MKKKKKNAAPAAHQPTDMPSLRAFWEELQRSSGVVSLVGSSGSALAGSRGSRGSRWGSFRGGDDDALGYGLALIVPNLSDEERVQMILRQLCEKDAAAGREKRAVTK